MTLTPELWSVDPGKKSCAQAVFRDGTLIDVDALDPVALENRIVRWAKINSISLVVEMPERVHSLGPAANGKRRTGSTARDVIAVARVAEGLLAVGRSVGVKGEAISPQTWKGSSKKPPHHSAIWDALSAEERVVFGAAFTLRQLGGGIRRQIDAACSSLAVGGTPSYRAKWTHALDAVGLGLWRLGRIDRAGNRRGPRS